MASTTSLPSLQHETLAAKFLQYCGGNKQCQLTPELLAGFAGVQTVKDCLKISNITLNFSIYFRNSIQIVSTL
jgi:hypothetical protein